MLMNKFATGLLAGGVLGAAALTWALSDGRTRRRMMRDGKRVMKKCSDIVEDVL
jgi:gas vesicle protein